MRSVPLQRALTAFIEASAETLAGAVAAGAEVRFELESQGSSWGAGSRSSASVLYTYTALTGEFVAEHRAALERLPSHDEAVRELVEYEGLERYLASVGVQAPRGERRLRARAALLALVQEVFEGQSDFTVHPERVQAALEQLNSSTLASAGETTLVATLHGLTISSPELRLATGLTIARPEVFDGLPEGALASGAGSASEHLVVVLNASEGEPLQAVARGRAVVKELLRALRLFGDGRVTLGALAWVRVGEGRWGALALGTGGRPHGMLVVTAEQEDELRAFCNLVSRRAPHENELAWALRRFELGCERTNPYESLSDHLLALRVLLEPEGQASGLLPGRLAALCATPDRRAALSERVLAAIALERDVIAGAVDPSSGLQELARDMADHLRALLRDVICGHLDANLAGLADELLLAQTPEAEQAISAAAQVVPEPVLATASVEQMLGDASQAQEILDVFI